MRTSEWLVWPDGTYLYGDDWNDFDYAHLSDDYTVVVIPDEIEEDSKEFWEHINEEI